MRIPAVYFPIAQAFIVVEYFICEVTPEDPESSWEMMMKGKLEPREILENIRTCAKEAVEEGNPCHKIHDIYKAALPQMQTKLFETYIFGKLGMM